MTDIIKPGAGLLFMKVGTHANESLDSIIARKTAEIEAAGHAFWGYGGNTCHPETMVQPFAKSFELRGGTLYLCMQEMESRHYAEPLRADQYSVDGLTWVDIPPSIRVLGSRFALVIDQLERKDLELPLAMTRVGIGNQQGRSGDKYLSGRVDKACLEVTEPVPAAVGQRDPIVKIGLVARIVKPYAVYVRNR